MLSTTFSAFQDELLKIAAAAQIMSPEDAEKFFGSHAQRVANVEESAKRLLEERGIKPDQGTIVGRVRTTATPLPVAQPAEGMTRTHIRTAPHVPAPHTPLPHTGVPGGIGKAVQRGGSLLRAHAAPFAIGAGATALGAMALNRMRKKNAPSR